MAKKSDNGGNGKDATHLAVDLEEVQEQVEAADAADETEGASKKEGQCRQAKFIDIELKIDPKHLLSGSVHGAQLITHAWSEKAKRRIREEQANPELKKLRKKNPEPRNPEEEFQAARYIVDGKDCIPSVALKNAMVRAGMRMGRAKADLQEAIYVLGEWLVIEHEEMIAREDYVRIGAWNNRVADLRYRPGYLGWKINFKIEFNPSLISAEALVAILIRAGGVGLCEWRPEKGGQFGAFDVDLAGLALVKSDPPPLPDFLSKFREKRPMLSA